MVSPSSTSSTLRLNFFVILFFATICHSMRLSCKNGSPGRMQNPSALAVRLWQISDFYRVVQGPAATQCHRYGILHPPEQRVLPNRGADGGCAAELIVESCFDLRYS
jgi:hypothetical protein